MDDGAATALTLGDDNLDALAREQVYRGWVDGGIDYFLSAACE
jgi:hypothetical protein